MQVTCRTKWLHRLRVRSTGLEDGRVVWVCLCSCGWNTLTHALQSWREGQPCPTYHHGSTDGPMAAFWICVRDHPAIDHHYEFVVDYDPGYADNTEDLPH